MTTENREPRTETAVALRNEIRAAVTELGLTQRQFARKLKVNDTYVSVYLSDPTFRYADRVEAAFAEWKSRQPAAREHAVARNDEYIATAPSEQTIRALERIRATGDCGVIYGPGGVGKTEGVREYVARNSRTTFVFQALQMTGCCERWAVERFIKEASGLRGKITGRQAFDRFLEAAGDYFLVFEDAHLLYRSAFDLAVFFSDHAKTPVAFISNPSILKMVEERPDQVWRRGGLKIPVAAEYLASDDAEQPTIGYRPAEIRAFVSQYIESPGAEMLKECQKLARGRGHLGRLGKALQHVPKLVSRLRDDAKAFRAAVAAIGGIEE